MNRASSALLIVLALLIPAATCVAQEKDDAACKDHPLINRMPDYWLRSCSVRQFDAFGFKVGPGKTTSVEGALSITRYIPMSRLTIRPSALQILRNFESAVKRLGGSVVYSETGSETMKLARDGKEIWIEVGASPQSSYNVTVVEKQAMAQDIVANAEAFANDLNATGHVAVEGILFETGKSELKPESQAAIGEVAKLLKGDAALKVFVVGHTDNVGGLESNMKLSQDRAQSVVQSLVKTHGIEAARLKAFGAGPYAPVASNAAEEGRTKNRRVELVKQ